MWHLLVIVFLKEGQVWFLKRTAKASQCVNLGPESWLCLIIAESDHGARLTQFTIVIFTIV